MRKTIPFRIFRGDNQYIAECLDLAIVTQAVSLDKIAANILDAVALYLDGADLAELGFVSDPAVLATM